MVKAVIDDNRVIDLLNITDNKFRSLGRLGRWIIARFTRRLLKKSGLTVYKLIAVPVSIRAAVYLAKHLGDNVIIQFGDVQYLADSDYWREYEVFTK